MKKNSRRAQTMKPTDSTIHLRAEPDATLISITFETIYDDIIAENKKKSKKKKRGPSTMKKTQTKAELELLMMDENAILGRGDAKLKKNKSLAKTTKDGEEKVTRKRKRRDWLRSENFEGKQREERNQTTKWTTTIMKKTSRKPLTSKTNDLVLSLKTTSLAPTQLIPGTKTPTKHSLQNVRNAKRKLAKLEKIRAEMLKNGDVTGRRRRFPGSASNKKDLPAVSKMSWIR